MYFGLILPIGVFFVFIAFTMFLPVTVLMPQKLAICFTLKCGFIVESFLSLSLVIQLTIPNSNLSSNMPLLTLNMQICNVCISYPVHSQILKIYKTLVYCAGLLLLYISYFPDRSSGMKFLSFALTFSVFRMFG
ncbi:unnamed protein product [Brassica napus]|uniref:Vesicle transport protein n=1 Tax=Brassica napus TaxID=3708 RepID=A0A816K411_BRANA|nr:unnamed protein product [Brassica napus]